MHMYIEKYRRSAALVAATLMSTVLVFGVTSDTSAAPQNQPLNVNVQNTPLPVTGTVAATQSGTWQVGLTGVPAVQSGDLTELIDSFAGTVTGGGEFTEAASGDASWARSVRVMTNCFLGADCGNITVRVYTIINARSYLIDQFPMQNFLASTAVYEVIGTHVAVQLINDNPEDADNVGVAVFGRAN